MPRSLHIRMGASYLVAHASTGPMRAEIRRLLCRAFGELSAALQEWRDHIPAGAGRMAAIA